MNVTVENLAPCRRLVRVEVDAPAVDSAFEELTREIARGVRIPGFRPGKAPRHLVVQAYSQHIDRETKRKLIEDNLKEAIKANHLHVLGSPAIEEIQFGRGQAFQFAATVETAPEFEMPPYKGLPVRRPIASVTDADVERALTVLREQRINYRDVSRPAQEGDILVVNYTGTCDGKPLTDIAPTARGLTTQNKFWMHIKPGSFIPGFTEQLVGASAGDKRAVQVDFPADFVAPALSGRKGVFEVEAVQVKERILPGLDDEFARSLGADNVEELRTGVRRDLEKELRFKQSRDARNQIVKALLERVNFDLPESLVKQEARSVVFEIVRENQQRGVSREKLDEQSDEIYNYAVHSAKERVKASFLLGRVADRENLRVTEEEISRRILFLAEQNQIEPKKLVRQLRERNGIAEIHEQILTAKVLDFLELNAQIEEVAAPATLQG